MNREINGIIAGITEVLSGEPWYGKAVLSVLSEVNPENAFKKFNRNPHSMIDLLYHMLTWTEFTRKRLQKDMSEDIAQYDNELDWRQITPELHTWQQGISKFTSETNKIIEILNGSSDELLEEKVDYREYNYRHLLNGLIQHNIYHIGQIAYINKMN